MGTTNFENNLRTLRLAIKQGYNMDVHIKKLNTGSYIYIVSAVNTPGMQIYYTVGKYSKSGKSFGKIYVEVTDQGVNYDNSLFSIPDSCIKAILEFAQAI